MCNNTECPSRLKCYRFTALPHEFRQAYANFAPEKGDRKCEYFWAINSKTI